MAANSKIEWTDFTWNVSVGCSVVSEGCANCYAMRMAPGVLAKAQGTAAKQIAAGKEVSKKMAATIRLYSGVTKKAAGRSVWNGAVNLCGTEALLRPHYWSGPPRRVFVNSMSDLFHESIPEDFIRRVFDVMGSINCATNTDSKC